jgi:hypothetical protein
LAKLCPLLAVTFLHSAVRVVESETAMRQHIVAVVGAITILLIFSIELLFTDFFIAIDYLLVEIFCILLAAAFFFGSRKLSKTNARSGILVALALLFLGFAIGHIPTTPRKRFYILAHGVRVGESLVSAKSKFRAYESWTTDDDRRNLHAVSFRYVAGPGTADSVALDFDPKTLKVTAVTYVSD